MEKHELIGVWKLESSRGKKPDELGTKISLVEFKDDGRFYSAGIRHSQFQGLLPEHKHRSAGTWKVEDDTLEIACGGESYKSKIVINDNLLQETFLIAENRELSSANKTRIYRRVDAQ